MLTSLKTERSLYPINRTPALVYSEDMLVDLLKNKIEKGFNYLYDNYANALFAEILRIVPDKHTASDLLQELFITFYKNIDSYNPAKAKLYTWMLRIAKNLCIDTLRSKSYKNSLKSSELLNNHEVPCLEMIKGTELFDLRKLLHTLKPKYRVPIDLNYLQGYTKPEISVMLGIPLGTVKTRIGTGLIRLRSVV